MVSYPTFWCIVCGAFADTAPKLLTLSCRGKHEGKWTAGGMLGQLKSLKAGRHPKTNQPIPRPITLKQWELRQHSPPPDLPPRPRPSPSPLPISPTTELPFRKPSSAEGSERPLT